MQIVTRKQALAQGETTFFTGKPCRKGHVTPRYASTGHCVECVKEAARGYRQELSAFRAPARVPDLTAGGTLEQHAARIERDAADDLSDKLDALDRAHVAAVARLKADTQLAKDNARAASARAVRVALAALADAMDADRVRHAAQTEREALVAQHQAERQALAARVAARDAFKAGLRKCRAKIAPEHVETANAYVWAVAMARCAEVEQEDVCLGADRVYAGVQGYMMHADDVTATMDALKAYAPPSVVVPPAPEVAADTDSSDWLHTERIS
jgi:hypothetical protein